MLLRIARSAEHAGDRDGDHRRRARASATPRAALRDGHSTSGTLGIGLGAIRRLADFYDLYSVPGHGTALVAGSGQTPRLARCRCAGLARPITGETECGDVFGAVEADGRLTGVLCDGLGHGPLAASAATEAVAAVLEDPAAEPAALLERAHRRMAHTRGGALARGAGHRAGRPVRRASATSRR